MPRTPRSLPSHPATSSLQMLSAAHLVRALSLHIYAISLTLCRSGAPSPCCSHLPAHPFHYAIWLWQVQPLAHRLGHPPWWWSLGEPLNGLGFLVRLCLSTLLCCGSASACHPQPPDSLAPTVPTTCRAPACLSSPRRMPFTLLRSRVCLSACSTCLVLLIGSSTEGWDYYVYVHPTSHCVTFLTGYLQRPDRSEPHSPQELLGELCVQAQQAPSPSYKVDTIYQLRFRPLFRMWSERLPVGKGHASLIQDGNLGP